jgi:hypothetical protein
MAFYVFAVDGEIVLEYSDYQGHGGFSLDCCHGGVTWCLSRFGRAVKLNLSRRLTFCEQSQTRLFALPGEFVGSTWNQRLGLMN